MKYLVKHWINVDVLAEEVIETDKEFINNDIEEYSEPSENANFINLGYKTIRRTIEAYDTKSNISSKDGTSNK